MKKNLIIGFLTIASGLSIAFDYNQKERANKNEEKAMEDERLIEEMNQQQRMIAEMETIRHNNSADENLEKMDEQILSTPSDSLTRAMQGVWWLLSREDWTKDGQRRIDPVLGADPIGILSYAKNHFAAQFMKRDRTADSGKQVFKAGQNNTSAVGGYDAYFGTYEVNKETGKVAHTLIGSITPSNIGMTVYRDLRVSNDKLTIQLETTTSEGEPVTRRLVWKRIS